MKGFLHTQESYAITAQTIPPPTTEITPPTPAPAPTNTQKQIQEPASVQQKPAPSQNIQKDTIIIEVTVQVTLLASNNLENIS